MHRVRDFVSGILFVLAVVACLSTGSLFAQTRLEVTGEPLWEVKDGTCEFTLSGDTQIFNPGPSESKSGWLRFLIWLSPEPFPSPGGPVSILDLGQLEGGFVFANASASAPFVVPKVTGFHYMTLILEEYVGPGFVTHFAGRQRLIYLKQGEPAIPPLWKAPAGRVITVPMKKAEGMKVVFIRKGVQLGRDVFTIPKSDELSISAKLGRSGRTVVFGGSQSDGLGADWSFKNANSKWKGKSYRVGVLTIDHGVNQGKRVKSTYWLYFQKKGRGFFKGVHQSGKESFTNWGLFTVG